MVVFEKTMDRAERELKSCFSAREDDPYQKKTIPVQQQKKTKLFHAQQAAGKRLRRGRMPTDPQGGAHQRHHKPGVDGEAGAGFGLWPGRGGRSVHPQDTRFSLNIGRAEEKRTKPHKSIVGLGNGNYPGTAGQRKDI